MSVQQSYSIPVPLRSSGNIGTMASYLKRIGDEAKKTNCKLEQLMQRLDLYVGQLKRGSSPAPLPTKMVEKVPAVSASYTFTECCTRGEFFIKEKKFDEANQYYTKALELAFSRQEKGEIYWKLGNIARNQKDMARARNLYLQASSYLLHHHALSIDLSLALGDVERQLNNFDKAIEQYRKVYDPRLTVEQKMLEPLSSEEQKAQACFGLGEIAKRQGDFSYARKCFFETIKWTHLIAVKRETYWRLGEIARAQGKFQEAKEHYTKALVYEKASR